MSRDLVEQAMRGDRDAFASLAERRLSRMVGTAGLILRDPFRAEDATQEALIKAWRDLPGLRDPERFDAWLYRLLVRACQDQLRRSRHELRNQELVAEHGPALTDTAARLGEQDEIARACAA